MKKLVIAVFAVCAVPALALPPMQVKPSLQHRETQAQKSNAPETRGSRDAQRASEHSNALKNAEANGGYGVPGAPRAAAAE